MPYTVTVEGGFTVNSGAKAHVFQDIADAAFDPSYSDDGETAYILTEVITFKGMTPLAITNGTADYWDFILVFNET